ncbi:MAG: lipid-A-disaccharide synthase [Desulfonatronovibrionaceae bacterium]
MNKNLVWLNACETSADTYGALLMQRLRQKRPGLKMTGMGGPSMRAAGLDTLYRAEDLSLVGLTEVITALPRIAGYLKNIKKALIRHKPGVMVLMDAPDFNFRLARMAYFLNIPVIYFIAPQVWAWRKSRINFLKRYVSHLVCILPFEEEFFRKHGVRADFAGHPISEILDPAALEHIRPDSSQAALLPGSRKKEISSLLPELIKAGQLLRQKRPQLRFNIIQAPGIEREFLESCLGNDLDVTIIPPGQRFRVMKKCCLALAASGTATLECAMLELPTVVAYKVSLLSYLAGRALIDVSYISLPNLIMNRPIFPELIQHKATAREISSHALAWLESPGKREQTRQSLRQIKSLLGRQSATRTCAEITLRHLMGPQQIKTAAGPVH